MSERFPKGQEPDFPARILRGHLPSLMCDCDGERERIFFSFITAIKQLAASGENSASQVVVFLLFVFFPNYK